MKAKIIKEEVGKGIKLYEDEQKMLSAPKKSAIPALPSRSNDVKGTKAETSEVDLVIKEGVAMVEGELNASLPKRPPAQQEEWDIFTLPELPKQIQQQEAELLRQQQQQEQQKQSSLKEDEAEDADDEDDFEDEDDDHDDDLVDHKKKPSSGAGKAGRSQRGGDSWADLEGLALSPERVAAIEAQHKAMMANKVQASAETPAPAQAPLKAKKTPLPFEGIQRNTTTSSSSSLTKKKVSSLTAKRVTSTKKKSSKK